MKQPSKPSAVAVSPPSQATASATSKAAPGSTETVTRPDPGLARGKWEAPEAAFWVALAVLVVAAAAYVLYRLGILKLKKKDGAPPSNVRRS